MTEGHHRWPDFEGYTPTPTDLTWARNVLRALKSEGTWVYPDARLVYRIDQPKHTMELIEPKQLTDFQLRMHERTGAVFSAVGYAVTPTHRQMGELGKLNEP